MSIIKHVTLQKIVAHDFRYDPCIFHVAYEMADWSASKEEGIRNWEYIHIYIQHNKINYSDN